MSTPTKFKRTLDLSELLSKKSHFLLGPRATGKSFLIREQLRDKAFVIDLLKSDVWLRLSSRPQDLETMINHYLRSHPQKPWVVIDEVQKIPHLLDEVHRLIEEKNLRFLLTGSSVRKLKAGQANLLAGRAWQAELFPVTWKECDQFDLDHTLRYGRLPIVVTSKYPEEELDAYVKTYLNEEIQAEGLIRKLPQFSRFLRLAAQSSGEILNFAKLGNDAQMSPSTIREHYHILEDTLLGKPLPAWTPSNSRKASSTAKFYLFDIGVAHALTGIKNIERQSNLYGKSFEHFIWMELQAALHYRREKTPLFFWRSTSHHEVDFVLPDLFAIEVKSTLQSSERDAKGLKAFQKEAHTPHRILVSQDPLNRRENGIDYLHWETFLTQLWAGHFF